MGLCEISPTHADISTSSSAAEQVMELQYKCTTEFSSVLGKKIIKFVSKWVELERKYCPERGNLDPESQISLCISENFMVTRYMIDTELGKYIIHKKSEVK